MKFIPHKYQEFCIDYIVEHDESAIFLDMGLGRQNSCHAFCIKQNAI